MSIYQNAKVGVIHQYELYEDAARHGDLELAHEHFKAAELLEDFVQDFIPMCEAEL